MPSQSPDGFHIDPEKLKAAVKRLDEQLEKARENSKLLQDKDRQYDDLRGVLEDLPAKVTHPVMVPFGPLAFFEGHLQHTNEVMVQLSSEWFALKTTKHALGTVDRRKQRLKRDLEDVEREVTEIENRRRLALGEGARAGIPMGAHADPDGMLDIREPYDEDAESPPVAGPLGATVTRDADGYFDIREPLDEDVALSGGVASSASADASGASSGSDGWSSVRPDFARLRELEQLQENEEQDELAELDELVDSYERTGLPPNGVATSAAALGSPPTDDPAPSSAACNSTDIRSPADLYRLMSACGSSAAMDPVPSAPASATPAQAFAPPLRQPAEKAFSGEVREHATQAVAAAAPNSGDAGAAPKRVSKFKAERQAAGR